MNGMEGKGGCGFMEISKAMHADRVAGPGDERADIHFGYEAASTDS